MAQKQWGSIIAIIGPSGCGKTTFAEHLGKTLKGTVLRESTIGNPFIRDAHKNSGYILQNQLWFLLKSVSRWKRASSLAAKGRCVIMDTFPPKNSIHSALKLDRNSFALYETLSSQLTRGLPQPNLIIYLFDSPEYLAQRKHLRGKIYDRKIDVHYLKRMMQLHESWIAKTTLPVLRIRSRELLNTKREREYYKIVLAHLR